MKLAALTVLGVGAIAVTFAFTEACSSDATTQTVQTGKVPPAEEGTATSATDEKTFAMNTLALGEADRGGNKNKDAWKKFGYNLDGLITNVTDQKSPDLNRVCKRAQGAPATVHQDGDEGIDNALGKEILKLLDPFTPTPSKTLNDNIAKGDFTIMLRLKGLTDDANQTNTGLSGKLLVGGDFGETPPKFDTSTDWPYIQDPQVDIAGAYITKGVFVNGKGGASVKLSLSISGQNLSLTINRAIISFKHNGANLEDGTIAGIINTEEFVNGISSVAGRFSTDLCQGSTVEGIKGSIRQASDMLTDGTQDPNRTCDGISVGIGFTAKQVANPTKATTPGAAPPDPCDPANQKDSGAPPADAGNDAQQ